MPDLECIPAGGLLVQLTGACLVVLTGTCGVMWRKLQSERDETAKLLQDMLQAATQREQDAISRDREHLERLIDQSRRGRNDEGRGP